MYKLLFWIFRYMVVPLVTWMYDKVYEWNSVIVREATKDDLPFQ